MGQSRMNKVKTLNGMSGDMSSNVFWMSLEEAKRAIGDKYEFLADRYEQKRKKPITKHKL